MIEALWTEDLVQTAPSIEWPSLAFWKDVAVIARTYGATDDLGRLTQILVDVFACELVNKKGDHLHTSHVSTFRGMWQYGWNRIRAFVATHPLNRPRGVATIGIAYFAAIVCCLVHGVSDDAAHSLCDPLLGVCLGMVYTDTFFDDSTTTLSQKQSLIEFLNLRMGGVKPPQVYDATMKAADDAFALITGSPRGEQSLSVLRNILDTHHRCAMYAGDDDLKTTALKLGAQTTAVFASIIRPRDKKCRRTCELLGAWMQLLDDAADIDDDIAAQIDTHATETVRKHARMDPYWDLLAAVTAHTARALGEAASLNCGAVIGKLSQLAVLFISGLSYAKMLPRIVTIDNRFDVDSIQQLYRCWRTAYESSVIGAKRQCAQDMATGLFSAKQHSSAHNNAAQVVGLIVAMTVVASSGFV